MLEEQRQKIDQIDRQLVSLFEERMHITQDIAEIKAQNDLPILNNDREHLILKKVSSYLDDNTLEGPLRDLYMKLLDISKKYQIDWLSKQIKSK